MRLPKLSPFIKQHGLLLLILLVGLIFRLLFITQPLIDTFSWRQCSTAMMAENFFKGDWNIFYPQVNWAGPGPGYQGREFQTLSYLTAIGYTIFGQHDYIGRLVAVGFGMWGLFALYQLVLQVWDKKHALAATAMMAITPGSAFIDRSFLPDPVMVSLTTTCMWLFLLFLKTQRNRYLWLMVIAGCLGILSKLPGIIIGLPMLYALWVVYQQRNHLTLKKLWPVFTAAVVMLVPVMAYYLWAKYLSENYPPYHFAGSGNWLWNNWLLYIGEKFFLGKMKDEFEYWILGFPALFLFVLGLLFRPPVTAFKKEDRMPWFFHFLLAGCAVYYLLGARELVRNPWNFHLFLPVISVFGGRFLLLIFSIGQPTARETVFRISILFILMIGFNIDMMKKHLFTDERAIDGYRMGKEMKRLSTPGDLVVTIAHDIGDPVAIYYSGRKGWVFPQGEKWVPDYLPADDAVSIEQLESLRSKGASLFGIVKKQVVNIEDQHPELWQYINSRLRLVSQSDDYHIYTW